MTWETETAHKGRYNDRLYFFMNQKGYNFSTLALAAGITRRQMNNIFYGRSSPSIDTAQRICRVLHIKLDDIYPVDALHE